MENQVSAGSDHFRRSRDKLSEDIGGVVHDATDLLKNFSAQKLESTKARLSQARVLVTDGAKQYASMTDGYVHANPWKALGVATAAGMLIGFLLARR